MQNRKMSTCNRVDVESLGSSPTMPKNFPGIGSTYAVNMGWEKIFPFRFYINFKT